MASVTSSAFVCGALSAPVISQPLRGSGLANQTRGGIRSARRLYVVSNYSSSSSPCSSSSSSSSSADTLDGEREQEKCISSRRDLLKATLSAIPVGLFALPALALLEADDDESLLEKVKEDRRKRIEKRGAVASLKEETESVQKAVYELSKAGQAIDGGDYNLASSVLGSGDIPWVKEAKDAISKITKSPEGEGEAANFNAALQDLQSAVLKKDSTLSKNAFVTSASALSKWSVLSGLLDQIKGL